MEEQEEEEMLLHSLGVSIGFLQSAVSSAIVYIHTQIMLYQPLQAKLPLYMMFKGEALFWMGKSISNEVKNSLPSLLLLFS